MLILALFSSQSRTETRVEHLMKNVEAKDAELQYAKAVKVGRFCKCVKIVRYGLIKCIHAIVKTK